MPLGSENMQSAQIRYPLTQYDIGTATGHIGGNRNRSPLTGLGNDLGLGLVDFSIEYRMLDAPLF